MSAESHALVRFGEPDTTTAMLAAHALERPTKHGGSDTEASRASHNRPDAPGWSSAATAVHSMGKMSSPVLLVLLPTSQPPIVIDFAQRLFSWAVPLEEFPVEPQRVEVVTEALLAGNTARFEHVPRNTDALFWLIGLNSFAGELAWWLPATERFHMSRWPNLTELEHTPSQMRMIAMLANATLAPDELARVSRSSIGEVNRLLNALSMVGVLTSSSNAPEPTPRALPVAPQHGLFRRVLDRMSRRG